MDKKTFLALLRTKLSGASAADVEEQLLFYSEMIDDRVDEGMSEAEAVASLGTADEVTAQIVSGCPAEAVEIPQKKANRKMSGWEIALLAIGSPVWIALSVSAVAVILSVYLSVWAVIVSLWAVFASLAACAVGGVAAGVFYLCAEPWPMRIAYIACGITCAGVSILFFFVCDFATRGICRLTKLLAAWTKCRLEKRR